MAEEREIELYQVRFKRRAKEILGGKELDLQDCDIRYVVAESLETARFNAGEIGRAIERGLNINGHRYRYTVKIVSVLPIRINGYQKIDAHGARFLDASKLLTRAICCTEICQLTQISCAQSATTH